MVDENGPHYFVAFQTPGPNWVPGKKYNEQPEFFEHVGYMTEMQDRGLTILSGPFMEKAGGLNGVLADSGSPSSRRPTSRRRSRPPRTTPR